MAWPYHRPILHGDPGSGEGRGSVPPTFFGFWTLSHHGASGAQLTQLDPTDPKGPFSCHESAKDVAAAGSIWFYPLRFTAADRCLQHWHIEGIHEVACQVGCQMLPARCCLMLSSLFAENKASIYSSMSGPNSWSGPIRPDLSSYLLFSTEWPTVSLGQCKLIWKDFENDEDALVAVLSCWSVSPRCDVLSNSSQRLLPFLMASLHARLGAVLKGLFDFTLHIITSFVAECGHILRAYLPGGMKTMLSATYKIYKFHVSYCCLSGSQCSCKRHCWWRWRRQQCKGSGGGFKQQYFFDQFRINLISVVVNLSCIVVGEAICIAVHWCWQDVALSVHFRVSAPTSWC